MSQTDIPYSPPTSKAVAASARRGLSKPGDAADRTTPRFARHGPHVRAVLAQGGYPVLPQRCGR